MASLPGSTENNGLRRSPFDTSKERPLFFSFAPLRSGASERASAAFASKVGARGFPMFIELHELELHPIDFEEEFAPGIIDFGPDIGQRTELDSSGRAQLIEERHSKHERLKDIRLTGDFSTTLELACARCLEPVVHKVARHFDLLYRPQGADAGQEEISVTATEAEIGYYQGDGVLLEDVLREQVLLAVPLKTICREDCKGLCPQCGKNLNVEQCSCADAAEDPRWSALKDIRDKLEH